MTWTVIGAPGLSFRVDKRGLEISGDGQQQYRPATNVVGYDKIKELPARWTVFRSTEASEAASLISLDVRLR
jgi:hypothetical protein